MLQYSLMTINDHDDDSYHTEATTKKLPNQRWNLIFPTGRLGGGGQRRCGGEPRCERQSAIPSGWGPTWICYCLVSLDYFMVMYYIQKTFLTTKWILAYEYCLLSEVTSTGGSPVEATTASVKFRALVAVIVVLSFALILLLLYIRKKG